jgi:hypothetical protein
MTATPQHSVCHASYWRVHAKRARVLRRRGENVWFLCINKAGRAVYAWLPVREVPCKKCQCSRRGMVK